VDNYQARQLELTKKIEEDFKNGNSRSTIVEPVSDYINDNRICLTSVVFLPQDLENKIIDEVIIPLRRNDPAQYFYVPNSFHVTIRNIRTTTEPPSFSEIDIEKSKEVFRRIVPKHHPFKFEIKRLFKLPTSLAISAFSNKKFGDLALELGNELGKAGVPDNKIYANKNIVIGNTTISRFTKRPNSSFRKKVKELKNIDIGSFEVRKISLITTSAVCHPSKTKIIEEYLLS
jgi:2'-5' RNA ligase